MHIHLYKMLEVVEFVLEVKVKQFYYNMTKQF